MIDPAAIGGKIPAPSARFEVAVVGAGAAGCAEAIAAARAGKRVLLVDENPLPPGLIGLDVPQRFGGRFTAAVQRPERMTEQVLAAEPLLAEAFDAGVDVRLGTCAWGAWMPGAANRALPQPLLGIADEAASSVVGFEELVVAAGARDLSLGFEGADLPGVIGAQALHSLLARYDAFAGRRIVVVGSGALARDTAALAASRGVEIVETITLDGGWVPLQACGGADGVETLVLVDEQGERRSVTCDTVCLAVGLVPQIELPAVLGCDLVHDAARGGWVPVLTDAGRTSVSGVRVVGDAAGVEADDRLAWMRALLQRGGDAPYACICEEVSRRELIGVHPPRYLQASASGQAPLESAGAAHPDHVKRLTRAGMGACQGRRCREQVAMLLALDAGTSMDQVPLASYRIPVRPLAMSALADWDEAAEMGRDWSIWFGIEEQWTHWTRIPVDAE